MRPRAVRHLATHTLGPLPAAPGPRAIGHLLFPVHPILSVKLLTGHTCPLHTRVLLTCAKLQQQGLFPPPRVVPGRAPPPILAATGAVSP